MSYKPMPGDDDDMLPLFPPPRCEGCGERVPWEEVEGHAPGCRYAPTEAAAVCICARCAAEPVLGYGICERCADLEKFLRGER